MAQDLLHGADIATLFQESRGKRTTKGVGGGMFVDSGFPRKCLTMHRLAARMPFRRGRVILHGASQMRPLDF
jgi:hypothetical protein